MLEDTVTAAVGPAPDMKPGCVGVPPTPSVSSSTAEVRRESQPYNDPKCPRILTFYPTMEEFRDFEGYIEFMESRNAHLGGIAKVNNGGVLTWLASLDCLILNTFCSIDWLIDLIG